MESESIVWHFLQNSSKALSWLLISRNKAADFLLAKKSSWRSHLNLVFNISHTMLPEEDVKHLIKMLSIYVNMQYFKRGCLVMIRRVFEVEWLFILSQLNCDSLGVNRNDAINSFYTEIQPRIIPSPLSRHHLAFCQYIYTYHSLLPW